MLKLLKYLKHFKSGVILSVVFITLRAVTDLLLPTIMAEIVDVGIVNEDFEYIIKFGIIMIVVAIAGGVFSIIARYFSSKTGIEYGTFLREKVFNKIMKYSLKESNEIGTASLITRTTNDVMQMQGLVLMLLKMSVMVPVMAIGSIILAIRKDVPLTGIILITVIVMGIGIALIATKITPIFKTVQVCVDKINRVVRERLTGLRVIRAFDKIDVEQKKFNEANKEITDVSIRVNKIMAIIHPFVSIMFNISGVILVWFGGFRVNSGNLEVGDLMAFLQYANILMFSVMMLTVIFIFAPRASASASRILEVLAKESEIENPKEEKTPLQKKGKLEFENVDFYYCCKNVANKPAVSNISFTCNPGEYTAIIGGTGSGKSTIMNLIPRFYDVNKGRVLIDGIDIRQRNLENLRADIGYVPQKNVLFSGTISENIRYGKTNATKEEVSKAAKAACAKEFITKMDDMYESKVAQGGNNFSGGQKQRLAIARALVKKPLIYIFDDSFSALDAKTEKNLKKELIDYTKDSTLIVVAQKVSSIIEADQIIVLDEGKIVGKGKHEELLKICDVYKEIVLSQIGRNE